MTAAGQVRDARERRRAEAEAARRQKESEKASAKQSPGLYAFGHEQQHRGALPSGADEAQAPQPYMTGASMQPKGRIRTDYQASQAPGARGYMIVGDPGARLSVTGAKPVGANNWFAGPGATFSVEADPGKDGGRGYYFKQDW
jgi:hypothetical protein